jgi:hypothetical protein
MMSPRKSLAGTGIEGPPQPLSFPLLRRLAHWPEGLLFSLLCLGSATLVAAAAGDLVSQLLEAPVRAVKAGEKVSLRRSFRSPWNDQVIIKHVTAGCSCSQATVTPMTLSPGARADLDVTFNSDGKRPGRFEIVVAVMDDKGAYRELPVRFSIDVIPAR